MISSFLVHRAMLYLAMAAFFSADSFSRGEALIQANKIPFSLAIGDQVPIHGGYRNDDKIE
jgi:hypothetical protein